MNTPNIPSQGLAVAWITFYQPDYGRMQDQTKGNTNDERNTNSGETNFRKEKNKKKEQNWS